ncbi:hypothetical protein B0T17DRAFT_125510 [Bombardia bombarda]|uniref:Uncharacterized protein n=1 Tax=Bombardia bombarda TaxID=252184 RepID=A0AA39U0U7_9PEZI|nr:hypothetical protein B0T17DRAFT_125510 [Bombardia bombarda]
MHRIMAAIEFTTVYDMFRHIDMARTDTLNFHSVHPADMAVIDDQRYRRRKSFRIRKYQATLATLTITVRTFLYDILHGELYSEITLDVARMQLREELWSQADDDDVMSRGYVYRNSTDGEGGKNGNGNGNGNVNGNGNTFWDRNREKNWGKNRGGESDCRRLTVLESGEADSTGRPESRLDPANQWPTLVVLAGVTQEIEHMREDMRWWFRASGHEVKIVVLAKLRREPDKIREILLEKWVEGCVRLNCNGNSVGGGSNGEATSSSRKTMIGRNSFSAFQTTIAAKMGGGKQHQKQKHRKHKHKQELELGLGLELEQGQQVFGPLCDQVIRIRQSPDVGDTHADRFKPESYSVEGGGLKLEFWRLFLREPYLEGGERDVDIGVEDLKLYAANVFM